MIDGADEHMLPCGGFVDIMDGEELVILVQDLAWLGFKNAAEFALGV